MAKIVRSKGSSTYDLHRKKNRNKKIIIYILMLVGVILAYFTKGISLVLFLSFFFLPKGSDYEQILEAGEEGERLAKKALSKLPKKYWIIGDVTIYKEQGKNQLDHVVIGPNGVFVVETKNHVGIVSGDDEDVKVLQEKMVRGMPRESRFLNPTKQVETQVRAMKNWLKKQGYSQIPVYGIVYFSNSKTKVYLDSQVVPVFSARKRGARKMRKYIRTRDSEVKLGYEEGKNLAYQLAGRK